MRFLNFQSFCFLSITIYKLLHAPKQGCDTLRETQGDSENSGNSDLFIKLRETQGGFDFFLIQGS